MPIDVLVLSAAFLTGLLGGVHCTAMCGGIAAVLSPQARQHALPHALALNLGRIGSYSLAGLLAGTLGAVFVGVFVAVLVVVAVGVLVGVVVPQPPP